MGSHKCAVINKELEMFGYTCERIIGGGSFSTVVRAVRKEDKTKVAVKVLKKKKLTPKERKKIDLECEAMETLGHKNIIRLYDRQETESFLYLVLEYCHGGDLLAYMHKKKQLLEGEAFALFRQLVSAIELAHLSGYVHRDIKLENLLLCEDGTLKVGDWGFACQWDKDDRLNDFPGSLYYASPEIVKGDPYFGPESDVWSMGVTLFALVSGCIPFYAPEPEQIMQKIVQAPIPLHPSFSKKLKDLLLHMLDRDPCTRYTIEDIKRHPWYQACQTDFLFATGINEIRTFERAASIAYMERSTIVHAAVASPAEPTPRPARPVSMVLKSTTIPTTLPTSTSKCPSTTKKGSFIKATSSASKSSTSSKRTWTRKLRRLLTDPTILPVISNFLSKRK
eukprot:TRINITY_DN5437_c0_g1_i1.p1 TRINITY_DN5437_c0_g1~~TRINITY_DN5437_c0_g1_i1.p1  ORF type:complete len:402 (+),score=91.77 TRINITY_DN5437_c0_g1_i1:26-1207(+)